MDMPPLSAFGVWWSRYWVYSVGVPSVAQDIVTDVLDGCECRRPAVLPPADPRTAARPRPRAAPQPPGDGHGLAHQRLSIQLEHHAHPEPRRLHDVPARRRQPARPSSEVPRQSPSERRRQLRVSLQGLRASDARPGHQQELQVRPEPGQVRGWILRLDDGGKPCRGAEQPRRLLSACPCPCPVPPSLPCPTCRAAAVIFFSVPSALSSLLAPLFRLLRALLAAQGGRTGAAAARPAAASAASGGATICIIKTPPAPPTANVAWSSLATAGSAHIATAWASQVIRHSTGTRCRCRWR